MVKRNIGHTKREDSTNSHINDKQNREPQNKYRLGTVNNKKTTTNSFNYNYNCEVQNAVISVRKSTNDKSDET